jgi:hypothetical protein
MHGFVTLKDSKDSREQGHDCIIRQFQELPAGKIASEDMFDDWHEQACLQLKALYREGGFDKLFIGQAQNWPNMALKYVLHLVMMSQLKSGVMVGDDTDGSHGKPMIRMGAMANLRVRITVDPETCGGRRAFVACACASRTFSKCWQVVPRALKFLATFRI